MRSKTGESMYINKGKLRLLHKGKSKPCLGQDGILALNPFILGNDIRHAALPFIAVKV